MKEEVNQDYVFKYINLNEQTDYQEALNYINYINSNDVFETPYITGLSFNNYATKWVASLYFDEFIRDRIDVKVKRQVIDSDITFNRIVLRPIVSGDKTEMAFPLFNRIKLQSFEFLNNQEVIRSWDFTYVFKKDFIQHANLTYIYSINVDYNKVTVEYCGDAKKSLFVGKNQVTID